MFQLQFISLQARDSQAEITVLLLPPFRIIKHVLHIIYVSHPLENEETT
jgi:hypothetical protein